MNTETLTQGEIDAAAAATVVETPVVDAPEDIEDPPAVDSSAAEDPEPKPHKKGGFVRKIEKLETERELLRTQNQELLDRLAGKTAEAPNRSDAAKADAEPVLNDFQTYEEYTKALTRWAVRQEAKAVEEKTTKQAAEQKMQETFVAYNERVDEFRASHPDFDEALSEDIPLYEGVRLAIIELDNGPAVAYHLAQNPNIAKSLMDFTPLRAIAEVGKIAASLSAPPGTRRTPAPEPITPVGGGSARSTKDPGQMTPEQYRKWRESSSG